MSQITATSSNTAQIEYWNSSAGETRAQFQEALVICYRKYQVRVYLLGTLV
jgi:hypothetical protein